VLLADDLVNHTIVAYAAPTARIIHFGKRGAQIHAAGVD
jgi:siroheme synthase